MKMKHIMVEGYCDGKDKQEEYLCNGTLDMGIYCFKCHKFSYTFCPNEIAISNEAGIVEDYIGFGGEMELIEPSKDVVEWKRICKEKINEAYNDYMRPIENS